MMGTEQVPETLYLLHLLTRLMAREDCVNSLQLWTSKFATSLFTAFPPHTGFHNLKEGCMFTVCGYGPLNLLRHFFTAFPPYRGFRNLKEGCMFTVCGYGLLNLLRHFLQHFLLTQVSAI
jgi:hypothetical protein